MSDPSSTPTIPALFTALEQAFAASIEAVDPKDSPEDAVAELLIYAETVARLGRQLKAQAEERILEWLLENKAGQREILLGEKKYYGEKVKRTKLLSLPETTKALVKATLRPGLLEAAYGDEETADRLTGGIVDFVVSFVSTNGLKDGASKKALEPFFRAEIARLFPKASEEEVQKRLYAALDKHWKTEWPDRLANGKPQMRLGLDNLRFQHRRGGGTKKEFLAVEAGEEAAVA